MPVEDVIVAIGPPNGNEVVGSGLLIDERLVITCAHVVNSALGRDRLAIGRPTGQVRVQPHNISAPVSAEIDEGPDSWSDPPATARPGADLCLLRLGGPLKPPPMQVVIAGDDLIHQEFRAGGFPKGFDFDVAVGAIVGRDKHGLYLLRPPTSMLAATTTAKRGVFRREERPAGLIHEGFSGAPVEVSGHVVGILAEARNVGEATAYLVPASAFPERIARVLERISFARGSPNGSLIRTYLDNLTAPHGDEKSLIDRTVRPSRDDRDGGFEPSGPGAPESVSNVLERETKLVVLGEPGLGKSTLLRTLEVLAARQALELPSNAPNCFVPIRIQCGDYRGNEELEGLLALRVNEVLRASRKLLSVDVAKSEEMMKSWLTDDCYHFLLLIDALDETPAQFTESMRPALRSLLQYPHRIIVSCRAADYDQSLHDLATPVVLEELRPDQVHAHVTGELGEKGAVLFKDQIEKSEKLLKLASNPFMLDRIIDLARADANFRIPKNFGLLMRFVVEKMPTLRRRETTTGAVPVDIVQTALGGLGVEMLDRGERRPNLSDLRGWSLPLGGYRLDPVLLEAKRLRFLTSDGSHSGPVLFLHPLFAEYFAAAHLNQCLKENGDYDDQLEKRVDIIRWQNALVMLVAIAGDPKRLVIWLAERLRIAAMAGSLYPAITHPRLNLWLFWIPLGSSRSHLVLQCWQALSHADRGAVRTQVVDAFRAVVRYSGPLGTMLMSMKGSGNAPQPSRDCG